MYSRVKISGIAVSRLLADIDSCPFECSRSIQRPCPPACSAWMFQWWMIQPVREPILAWSHAGWCAPDTWMEAETRAMWIIIFPFFYVELQLFCCNVFNETPPATSQSYLPLLVRVTPAAPWCALERSTVWCHGVKDVRSPATPGSTSRCVSSTTGSTTSSRQTPEEVSRFTFTANLTLPPPASSKTTSSLPSLWRHRQTHEPECRQQNKHLLVHPHFSFICLFIFLKGRQQTCLTKQYTRSTNY